MNFGAGHLQYWLVTPGYQRPVLTHFHILSGLVTRYLGNDCPVSRLLNE